MFLRVLSIICVSLVAGAFLLGENLVGFSSFMETAGAFLACFSFGDVTVGADVEERFLEGDVSVVLGDAFGVVCFREERLSFLRNMQKGVYHDRNMNMS